MAARCGAKTRSGHRCKKPAGWGTNHPGTGRCRLHGGCSTGPPKGNKNAVRTGEYETILLDALDDEERRLYAQIQTDKLNQLDHEIRLLTIRERRMLRRIARLREAAAADVPQGVSDPEMGFVATSYDQMAGKQMGVRTELTTIRREQALTVIQRIEQALTRVQMTKARLIALQHQIETGGGDNDGTLRELADALKRSREAHG